jgi:hypothetical protein
VRGRRGAEVPTRLALPWRGCGRGAAGGYGGSRILSGPLPRRSSSSAHVPVRRLARRRGNERMAASAAFLAMNDRIRSRVVAAADESMP